MPNKRIANDEDAGESRASNVAANLRRLIDASGRSENGWLMGVNKAAETTGAKPLQQSNLSRVLRGAQSPSEGWIDNMARLLDCDSWQLLHPSGFEPGALEQASQVKRLSKQAIEFAQRFDELTADAPHQREILAGLLIVHLLAKSRELAQMQFSAAQASTPTGTPTPHP